MIFKRRHALRRNMGLMAAGMLFLSGCAESVYDTIKLMPSPVVYTATKFDPFTELDNSNFADKTQLYYVTDRAPAENGDKQMRYSNRRGYVLRAGTAEVKVTPPNRLESYPPSIIAW